jgi:hypothetical protein
VKPNRNLNITRRNIKKKEKEHAKVQPGLERNVSRGGGDDSTQHA